MRCLVTLVVLDIKLNGMSRSGFNDFSALTLNDERCVADYCVFDVASLIPQ